MEEDLPVGAWARDCFDSPLDRPMQWAGRGELGGPSRLDCQRSVRIEALDNGRGCRTDPGCMVPRSRLNRQLFDVRLPAFGPWLDRYDHHGRASRWEGPWRSLSIACPEITARRTSVGWADQEIGRTPYKA